MSKNYDFFLRQVGCPFVQRGVVECYVEQAKGPSVVEILRKLVIERATDMGEHANLSRRSIRKKA